MKTGARYQDSIKLLQKSLVFVFLLSTLVANAALPTTINYQGYLTDSTGSPLSSPPAVNITFRLYTTVSGGSMLWSETQAVTVSNGLFNVELGSLTPLNLPADFNTPLYLGIQIGTDGEMIPRKPLTLTGYSAKAVDADTLEGFTAAELNQSAHVTNTSNPHHVTAAQVGAATPADISTHAANPSAHHSKTSSFTELSGQIADAQVPAAITRDSELAAHTANPSAHHTRFSNAEALSAMGTKADSNPLNHDKPSNAQIMGAVLAQDGAGSALDADMVDGLHASDIIDAAGGDARTAINTVPYTINAPGSYYLAADLSHTGTSTDAITINADNVTLNLNGFTLSGPGTSTGSGNRGIVTNGTNTVLLNGSVTLFGGYGIYEANFAGKGMRLANISAIANGNTGAFLGGTEQHVISCYFSANLGHGVRTGSGSIIEGSIANLNGGDGIIVSSTTTIRNNITKNNALSGIYGNTAAQIVGNTVAFNNSSNSTTHGGIYVWEHSLVKNNTFYGNQNAGIYVAGGVNINGSAIEENHITQSIGYGIIFAGSGNLFTNNRLSGNNADFSNAAGQVDGGGNIVF